MSQNQILGELRWVWEAIHCGNLSRAERLMASAVVLLSPVIIITLMPATRQASPRPIRPRTSAG